MLNGSKMQLSKRWLGYSFKMLRYIWCLLIIFIPLRAYSNTPQGPKYPRSKAFECPEKLRPRVNFWKDIFTKYGKAQFVIHHREFPQVVFMVVDLSNEFRELDPISFDRLRKSEEKRRVSEIKSTIEYLAEDKQPQSYLQKYISAKMQFLGAGTSKYKRILDEDLIRTQTGIKEKFADSVRRAGRYLPLIEKIFVEDFGLPVELTRLPFIESSFDYTAYSSVGAAGIWQFMPRTGKLYMTVNKVVDERRDPLQASRGAAKYLREAYSRLGNWPLAVTSYNHGVAGVNRKVQKMGTTDIVALIENKNEKAFGFASSNFYPEFLAAIEIYDNYRQYFPDLELEQPIKAKEVFISRSVSVAQISKEVGVGIEALKSVNYALSEAVWSGRVKIPAGYSLKVPHDSHLHLAYSRQTKLEAPTPSSVSSSIYGGVTYKVRRGDSLISIAKKYGTSVSDLNSMNNLGSGALKVGQTIIVKPREDSLNPVQPQQHTKVVIPTKATNQFKSYKVKKGDSLWSISIKNRVSADQIRKNNKGKLIGNNLTVGQTILIPQKTN